MIFFKKRKKVFRMKKFPRLIQRRHGSVDLLLSLYSKIYSATATKAPASAVVATRASRGLGMMGMKKIRWSRFLRRESLVEESGDWRP